MGVLAKDNHQFTYSYSSTSSNGKQGNGYVESLGDQVQILDISKTNLGSTIGVERAEKMGKNLENLLSLEHRDAPETKGSQFSSDDWFKVLKKSSPVLKKPILINGDDYLQVTTPSEILIFFGIDSAGRETKPLGKDPTTSPTTEDEKYIERNPNDSRKGITCLSFKPCNGELSIAPMLNN